MVKPKNFDVVFILKDVGFPFGMASVQRIKLLAKSLSNTGVHVKVLCITAIDKKNNIINKDSAGVCDGIPFLYTTGKTYRSDSFIKRRFVELRGLVCALIEIWRMKNNGKIIRVYLYGFSQRPSLSLVIITLIMKCLRIPVMLDLCEAPWQIAKQKRNILYRLRLLKRISGVITISKYLQNWCIEQAKNYKYDISILRIPILAENSPIALEQINITNSPSVLFACSQEYDTTIEFILESMNVVWGYIPECRLIITGSISYQEKINNFLKYSNIESSKVFVSGYLPRNELYIYYRQSWALLIPLFDDIKSKARFPTKIGEYLSTGRPIVTTDIGEIQYFFIDGENAFVSRECKAQSYGEKIIEALSNLEKAKIVGHNGFITYSQEFDYEKYSCELFEFFKANNFDHK